MFKLLAVATIGFLFYSCAQSGAEQHQHLTSCLAQGKTERTCDREYMQKITTDLKETRKELNKEFHTLVNNFQ